MTTAKQIKEEIERNENEMITLLRYKYGEQREALGFYKGYSIGITLLLIVFLGIKYFQFLLK